MNDIKKIEERLLDYCEGKLSDDECKEVENWILSNKENENIAREIHELYWAVDTLNIMRKTDSEKALRKVRKAMFIKKTRKILFWLERTAAVMFIPLFVGYLLDLKETKQEATFLEVKTNPGMITCFALPDGTKVTLNSGSVLRYPEFFSEEKREIFLLGEAFFDVTKDAKKKFIVRTSGNERVEVLGTSFNLEAFASDSIITTTLISGKINFISGNINTIMQPGEKLIYSLNTSKSIIEKTDGSVETAWKDGKIVFHETSFTDVLRMLSKRYNVDFELKNDTYRKDSFTGTFTKQRIEQIMDVFSISSNIRWRYKDTDKAEEKRSLIEIY